jgi:hypothetical protein
VMEIMGKAKRCHLQPGTRAERVGFEPTVQFDPHGISSANPCR